MYPLGGPTSNSTRIQQDHMDPGKAARGAYVPIPRYREVPVGTWLSTKKTYTESSALRTQPFLESTTIGQGIEPKDPGSHVPNPLRLVGRQWSVFSIGN